MTRLLPATRSGRLLVAVVTVGSLTLPLSAARAADAGADGGATGCAMVRNGFAVTGAHLADTAESLPSATVYPVRSNAGGAWVTSDAAGWTSGFFPGSLWLMYEGTGDEKWRALAERWQAGIESQKSNTSTHDLGFMIHDSFGHDARLTGDTRAAGVVRSAAASLARRFKPSVGSIRSWGSLGSSGFTVIIDNLMNLEMQFWAARNGGSEDYYDQAVSHALNARKDHVRADGSTYHVVEYNPTTGLPVSRHTSQGYGDTSTWSRGQAWAVYGFTLAYRETEDARFLDTARRTSDYFLAHLPEDDIPYWDFDLPSLSGAPRDSSAAAIAASGLLELSTLEPDAERAARYRAGAVDMLEALSTSTYLAGGTTRGAALLHGTQNKPAGSADTGLVFGDYYYLEALLRHARIVVPGCSVS